LALHCIWPRSHVSATASMSQTHSPRDERGALLRAYNAVPVFTEEVSTSLADLMGLFGQMSRRDEELRQKMQAAAMNVASSFESQVVMMFQNFAVQDKEQKQRLLQRETHEAIAKALNPLGDQEDLADVDDAEDTVSEHPKGKKLRTGKKGKKGMEPLDWAHRHLACGLYLTLEALATRSKAERAVVYLHSKATNVLEAVCTVPQSLQKIQVSATSGLLGMTFSSGTAFNVAMNDPETRLAVKSIDGPLGTQTRNLLSFPIRNARGQLIGILELANKMRGSVLWEEGDEALAHQSTYLLAHYLSHYPDTSFLTIPAFDPSNSLQLVSLWIPCMEDQHPEVSADVKSLDKLQLVFRNHKTGELPQSWKMLKEAEKLQGVASSSSIKEVQSYLMTLEESYRQGLAQCVQSDQQCVQQQQEIQKRNHRIRILEDNVAYLESCIRELREQLQEHERLREQDQLRALIPVSPGMHGSPMSSLPSWTPKNSGGTPKYATPISRTASRRSLVAVGTPPGRSSPGRATPNRERQGAQSVPVDHPRNRKVVVVPAVRSPTARLPNVTTEKSRRATADLSVVLPGNVSQVLRSRAALT